MSMLHDHDRNDCPAMFEKLSEYIDNELDDLARQTIEDHARKCIPCKVCLKTHRQTIGLSRALASDKIPVPETFSTRLKAVIHKMSHDK